MDSVRIDILSRIVRCGGIYGLAAEKYMYDQEKGNLIIKECFEQAHHKSLWEYLGIDLALDLVNYRVKYLRSQFEELYAWRMA